MKEAVYIIAINGKTYSGAFDTPEKISEIDIVCSTDTSLFKHPVDLSLPKKKKVKKWQFCRIIGDNLGRPRAKVTEWMTDSEAFERSPIGLVKIENTMIEIEEDQ